MFQMRHWEVRTVIAFPVRERWCGVNFMGSFTQSRCPGHKTHPICDTNRMILHPALKNICICGVCVCVCVCVCVGVCVCSSRVWLFATPVCVCVCVCVGVCVCSSHAWLFATPCALAPQAPLSMAFPGEEHKKGLPFPLPGGLLNSEAEPLSPALTGRLFTTDPLGKPLHLPRQA